jgi:hypothetical protein
MSMNDNFHTTLRACRERQALSITEIASIVGLSIAEYCDLENVPSEWRMVTPLLKIKVLVRLLKIDMSNVLTADGSRYLFPEYGDASEVIKINRGKLGLSPEEFADKVGFHPAFCTIVESHSSGLELYPAEVSMLVAGVLHLPPDDFVSWMIEKT